MGIRLCIGPPTEAKLELHMNNSKYVTPRHTLYNIVLTNATCLEATWRSRACSSRRARTSARRTGVGVRLCTGPPQEAQLELHMNSNKQHQQSHTLYNIDLTSATCLEATWSSPACSSRRTRTSTRRPRMGIRLCIGPPSEAQLELHMNKHKYHQRAHTLYNIDHANATCLEATWSSRACSSRRTRTPARSPAMTVRLCIRPPSEAQLELHMNSNKYLQRAHTLYNIDLTNATCLEATRRSPACSSRRARTTARRTSMGIRLCIRPAQEAQLELHMNKNKYHQQAHTLYNIDRTHITCSKATSTPSWRSTSTWVCSTQLRSA